MLGAMTAVAMADTPKRPYGPRPPKSPTRIGLNLRIPEALHKKAHRSATLKGMTLSEWIRGAMRMRLESEAA